MNRKHSIALILFIILSSAPGFAASDIVEIFYLPHPPAMAVVREVEDVVKRIGSVTVKKYNFEDRGTGKMLEKYHITNHMPVAIFINGKNEFVVETKKVVFENFPKGNAFVPMFEGNWSYRDIESVLQAVPRGN